MSDVLEVHLDGPRAEDELFQPICAGCPGPRCLRCSGKMTSKMVLTPYSRWCLQLWGRIHARRFSCLKKPRGNAGIQGTGWRHKGSDAAVQQGHRTAVTRLVACARANRAAAKDHEVTIFGTQRSEFAVPASSTDFSEGNALHKFHKKTAERLQTKAKNAASHGAPRVLPPLRVGGAMSVAGPVGRPAGDALRAARLRAAAPAAASPLVHLLYAEGCDVVRLPSFRVTLLRENTAPDVWRSANIVVVKAKNELDGPPLHARSLVMWLTIVATGKAVVLVGDVGPGLTSTSSKCLRFKAAVTAATYTLTMPATFTRTHPEVVQALQRVCGRERSRWKLASADVPAVARPPAKAAHLQSLAALQKFLRDVRRFDGARGVQGTYAPRTTA